MKIICNRNVIEAASDFVSFSVVMTNVRSPNSVIFVRFMFPTKSMHHIRQGLRCNIIE